MRIEDAQRHLVMIRAELQKAETGGGAEERKVSNARARQPSNAAQRGDAPAARGRGGAERGPPRSPRPLLVPTLPLPPPLWAQSFRRCFSRLASGRPGAAQPAGRCPEPPLSPSPTPLVAVWEAGVRPRAAKCEGRGRGPPGAAESAAPRGPCIS